MYKVKIEKKKSVRWNTLRITAAGFLGIIFLGGVLLYLPVSNQGSIAFIDALFTSVSAVCVTGLLTITPASQFTLFGKMILLLLIQAGGLGIIACAALFFLLLRRRITLRERIVLEETYSTGRLGGIVGLVRKVIIGTLFIESMGALMYAIQFVPQYGVLKGAWYSVFHAVSAFCNAGIDILGENSLAGYVTNPVINITTILLIILSGIGFTVWFDIIDNVKRLVHREVPLKWWFTRLKLHTKLAIIMTLILLSAGTAFVFFSEYHNPGTIGKMRKAQNHM